MREVPTYCRICEPQCAMIAQVESDGQDEQVIKLIPDRDHPVHKGFACHKGLNFTELHNDPDRIDFPQIRSNERTAANPQFSRVTWDAAADGIADRIRALQEKYGHETLGFYIGNPSAFNSTGREGARMFAQAAGARYRFGSGTQDCTNKFAASEVVYGTANLHPIPDYRHTRYFLSLGSNPRISHVSFVHMTDPMGALRDIVARGGKVLHVNPRVIESATPKSGEVVQIKPDTDVYFLAALIHEIRAAGLQDDAFIEAHATNVEGLWSFVADYAADQVADVTGIDAQQISSIARDFATADGASVHMSTGVNMGRQGTLAYWLLQMLSLITGNLGRRGGNIYSPGYFPAATVGKPKKDDPFFDSQFGEIRRIAGSLPGNLLADYIEAGIIKGLVVMSGNPLLSMAGESRLAKAFASLELMIVVDIYPNATAQFADFILPATDWLERPDVNSLSLGFQPDPYVQYSDAVVSPRFERKPEWWIFARLSQALALPSLLDQEDPDPMSRIDRQLNNSDLSLEQLAEQPSHTVRLPDPDPQLLFKIGVQGEGRRVNCFPDLIARGVASCRMQFEELVSESVDTLKLISLRTNYMVNSWMHNLPSLKREIALDNPLHINPQDAERLQLGEGTEVSVTSAHGRIIATVAHDESLRPGVVAMTHGWGHSNNPRLSIASNHPGANVNALLPTGTNSFDPLSNMSHMTGIPVQIDAA